jgi:general stress protein 26
MAENHDPIAKLNQLISGIDIAILTTVRPDGTLHSCPMACRGVDAGGAFWFLTGSNTEKVEAVRTNLQVNVAFTEPAAQRYVSVSGLCELVRDHAMAKALWDDSYTSWFPGGLDDPNLILMKINVRQAEYWDSSANRMVVLEGFNRPAIL